MLKNTEEAYGLIAIALHWLMAIVIVGLFILGIWMVGLDYYSEWYKVAPDTHRSIGVLLGLALIFRLLFRFFNVTPKPEPNIKRWEHLSAVVVRWLLYLLILVIIITGYLISTADGRPVDVFGWFQIPATITSIENQEDLAGEIHYYLAVSILCLAGLHAIAALKHHFIDKDATLKKMLGIRKLSPPSRPIDD